MGNTVSPCLLKHSAHGTSRFCSFATTSVRGARTTMEDAHICKMTLTPEYGMFAVIDGHGGDFVAKAVAKRMTSILTTKVSEKKRGKRTPKAKASPYKSPKAGGKKGGGKLYGGGGTPKKQKVMRVNIEKDQDIVGSFMQLDLKIAARLPQDDVSGSTFIGIIIPYPEKNQIHRGNHHHHHQQEEKMSENEFKTPTKREESKMSAYLSLDSEFSPVPNFAMFSAKEELALATTKTPNNRKNNHTKSTAKKRGQTPTHHNKKKRTPRKEEPNHGSGGGNSSNLIAMNVGDSRAIMYRDGKTLPLSTDHKPDNEMETARIRGAGCTVINQRVEGMLAVSRAFGDFEFKKNKRLSEYKQAVVCTPDIRREMIHFPTSQKVDSTLQFIVIACDGIWDVMTNEEVNNFVKQRFINYKLFDDNESVPQAVTFPYEGKDAPWQYKRVRDWTIEHVQAWKQSLDENTRSYFAHYSHLNGSDLMRAVKLSKRSHNARKKKTRAKPLPVLGKNLCELIINTDDTIRHFLKRPQPKSISTKLRLIVEQLIDECIVIRGSQDNCSATIVVLHDIGNDTL